MLKTGGKIMARIPFSEIWNLIEINEGKTFYQQGGKPFTYEISGTTLRPSTTNRNLPRSQFEKAYSLLGPNDGPGVINHLQGPSYLWGILQGLSDTEE